MTGLSSQELCVQQYLKASKSKPHQKYQQFTHHAMNPPSVKQHSYTSSETTKLGDSEHWQQSWAVQGKEKNFGTSLFCRGMWSVWNHWAGSSSLQFNLDCRSLVRVTWERDSHSGSVSESGHELYAMQRGGIALRFPHQFWKLLFSPIPDSRTPCMRLGADGSHFQ